MIAIRYQILFTITLQHDYYARSPFNDLAIVPSPLTSELLRGHKIIYRKNENVFTAMIQTNAGKPFITISDSIVFRFFVIINNDSFSNFSALKMVGAAGGIYYFSNKIGHKKNNRLYLTAPVPLYKSTESYEIGAVAKKATRIFECIKANSADNKHDTTDVGFWRDIVIHQSNYLTAYSDTKAYNTGDLVKEATKVYEALKPSNSADRHNTTQGAFWHEITDIAYVSNADFSNAAAIGGEAIPQKTFGIIDIVSGAGETADFALLKPNGETNATAFFVRFKNRSTLWKYISLKKAITAINDISTLYSFSNAVLSHEFVSTTPIPLTKAALSTIEMTANINARTVITTGLQNASAAQIIPTNNTTDFNLFSEIYLNY